MRSSLAASVEITNTGICGKFYYVFRFINIEQIIKLQIINIIIVIYCICVYAFRDLGINRKLYFKYTDNCYEQHM